MGTIACQNRADRSAFQEGRHAPAVRVLAVVADADARKAFVETLEALGYAVQAAGSAAEALELPGGAPDVVLSELELPDGSGARLLERLRSRPGWSDVPGVAILPAGWSEPTHRLERAGFVRFLPKPVCLPDLHAALQEAVRVGV